MDPQHSERRSLETNALIKNCRIQLPKPRRPCGSTAVRARNRLSLSLSRLKGLGTKGPKESPGCMPVPAKTTRNERSIEEERRKERTKVYSVCDGDVPRVAATDFAGNNNVDEGEEREEKR